jgi:hypothetical protein
MVTGVVESTTGEVWSASSGTGPDLKITNTLRLTEWRTWPQACDDMIRFALDFAEADDRDLKVAQERATKHPDVLIAHERPSTHAYPTTVEALNAILDQHPPEMDTECHMWLESWTGDRYLFSIERDAH